MSWQTLVICGWLVLATGTSVGLACPFCETETAKQVQAGIFNDEFWKNAALTLFPLFILLGIVGLIHFDCSRLWCYPVRRKSAPNDSPEGTARHG